MSDNQNEPLVPTPAPPPPEVVDASFAETESTRVDHMMSALANLEETPPKTAEEQRSEYEQTQLLHKTEQQLINMAVQDTSLVHSASAVFNELRYYDAMRLKAYALNIYTNLVKTIGESPQVPMVVKKNLPVSGTLGTPITIDPNELPTMVTVSVHHRPPCVEVVITFEFRSGRANVFTTGIRYQKN